MSAHKTSKLVPSGHWNGSLPSFRTFGGGGTVARVGGSGGAVGGGGTVGGGGNSVLMTSLKCLNSNNKNIK